MVGAPAFCTFTYGEGKAYASGKMMDIKQGIEDWRQFTKRFNKAFPEAAFVRVPDRHKSGGVHFHAAIFGLPEQLQCIYQVGFNRKTGKQFRYHACPESRLCERKTRQLWRVWGKGFVDVQKARKADRIGAYIAKYLSKDNQDWTLFGQHVAQGNSRLHSLMAAARDAGVYYQLSSYSMPGATDTTLQEIREDSRLQPRYVGEFDTRWLGRARYELYEYPPPVDKEKDTKKEVLQ